MQKKMGKFYLGGLLKLLPRQKKSGSFLEIGPGPGYRPCAKRNPQAKITAVEPSADMIEVARGFAGQQGLSDRIALMQRTVEDDLLIAGLGSFDLIYSTFSLHHWKDQVQGIRSLYQALGGKGVLHTRGSGRHGQLAARGKPGRAASLSIPVTQADQVGLTKLVYQAALEGWEMGLLAWPTAHSTTQHVTQ